MSVPVNIMDRVVLDAHEHTRRQSVLVLVGGGGGGDDHEVGVCDARREEVVGRGRELLEQILRGRTRGVWWWDMVVVVGHRASGGTWFGGVYACVGGGTWCS